MRHALRLLLDRKRRRGSLRAARIEPLEPRTLLAGDPLISEFMAINNSTLADGDGDYPDWIEIYNPADVAVDLDGWYLTDNNTNPAKWQFPDVQLAAGDYLIVFASEKNNPPPGELHANFKLSAGGEYLALVKPDGLAATTEFDPYPQQVADVAYGLGVDATVQTLLQAGDPVRAYVPADGSLGLAWTEPGFNDDAWTAGTGGVGFDTQGDYAALIGTDLSTPMLGNNAGAYVRSTFNVADPAAIDALSLGVQYDDGFVAYLNGREVASRNAVNMALSPETGLVSYYDFEGDTQDKAPDYLNNSGTLKNDLSPIGNAPRYVTGDGRQAIAINAAGGDLHHLEAPPSPEVDLGAVYTFEAWINPTALSGWSRMMLNWAAPMAYHFALKNGTQLSLIQMEQGKTGTDWKEAIGGTVVTGQWQHVAGVADGTNLIVYLNGQEVGRTAYDGTINTTGGGLGIGDMAGISSTIPFMGYMDDLAVWNVPLTESQIRSHFLAGTLGYGLTELGASAELGWNSAALQDRPDESATAVETIDVSPFAEFLTPGENVLAVHGLNASVGDDDFLIRTELQAADLEIRPDVKRYFATPTPEGPNGTGANDLGPIVNSVEHELVPPLPPTTVRLVQAGDAGQFLVPDTTSGPAMGDTWTDPDYVPGTHGETWTTAPSGFGFDDDGNFAGSYNTDLAVAMTGNNASAYFRHEFDLPSGTTPEGLTLDVKYDDGFVAYLNGEQIARRNAPSGPPGGGTGIAANLVQQWQFEGNTLDASESGNDGTFIGGTETYVSGRAGQAISLAAGEKVEDTGPANLPTLAGDSWTVNLWANYAATPPEGAYLGGIGNRGFTGGNGSKRSIISQGGDVYFWGLNVNLDTNRPFPAANQWHMYTATYDATTLTVYLDGTAIGSAAKTFADAPALVSVGGSLDFLPNSFVGAIDEFAIWDGALSPANVLDLFNLVTPESLEWDSAATAERPDADAVQFEQIDVSGYAGLLEPAGNVLAIHALNGSPADGDFLMAAQLTGRTGGGDSDLLRVSAEILPTLADVGTVTLHHRVMFDTEQSTVMADDGSGYDEVAGDGIFTGLVPLDWAEPGEMVRYYVTAGDVAGVTTRAPLFPDPNNSPEYFGTVLDDPAIQTDLPVLQRFVANPGAAETRSGTRASIYYAGEFYDNVFLRMRGGTSANWPKKSYKIDFNDGRHFRFDDGYARVEEINLNTTYTDKSYLRRVLAYETFRDSGSPYSEAFPIRIEQNGEFWTVSHIVEQVDRDYLRRNGLDENGALYKAGANNLDGSKAASNGITKKNRKEEGSGDLQAFINGLAQPDGSQALENFIFDNVNLPGQISYMAANIINQNIDRTVKNYYAYRDSDGTGEWQMLPWDVDLTFGPDALNTDVVKATFDGAPDHTSHPFLGGSEFPFRGLWNRFLDVVYKNDTTREMFLRRLRTLMDEMLGPPPESPGEGPVNPYFENRVAELGAALGPDVLLDKAKWGANAHFGSTDPTLQQEIDELITAYFEPRRTHLYETHNIDNVPSTVTTVLASGAPARALVPVNDSLGLSWTERVFDDGAWFAGTTGVGYDEADTYDSLLGIDLRTDGTPADNDLNNDLTSENDSVFIRIPFDVDDPDALTQLKLRMKYDDGFVAYINGVRVAWANDPAGLTWNSASTGQHDDSVALVFQDFDVSAVGGPGGILVAGTNVLAIHGLNDNTNGTGTSSDMLLLPEIINGTPGYAGSVGIPNMQAGNPAIGFGTVMFNPGPNQDEEFIELINGNATAVDVSGWRLDGAVDLTFAPSTVIPAGGTLYVSPNVAAFRARGESPTGGEGLFVQGNYGGHLSNFGETINLRAADGTLVNSFTYEGNPSDAQDFLRISEIMYNPPAVTQADVDAGFADPNQFEFIELANTSPNATLDLTGVRFTDGVVFDFTGSAATSLAPGGRVLVVRDEAAMNYRYTGISALIAGQYTGGLKDGGEPIKLEDAENSTVAQFEYKDGPRWPRAADGGGSSLVAVSADADLDSPNAWHASVRVGGSPGEEAAALAIGRHVFYDGSSFDTGGPEGDDAAIATDKTALLPGQTATAANYTNYSGGINGIIVDLAHAPRDTPIDEFDFTFAVGNDDVPDAWQTIAAPSIAVRPGQGRGGSDRVVLSWTDAAPANAWLQVILLGGAGREQTTGLLANDVFYFGNAVGETGNDPETALVNAADVIAIRDHPRGSLHPSPIDGPHDVNRDGFVDAVDLILARNNAAGPLGALRLLMLL